MGLTATLKGAVPYPARRLVREMQGAALGLALRGGVRHCDVCDGRFRRFLPFKDRPQARCPRCGSLERHRQSVGVYRDRLGLLPGGPGRAGAVAVLHVAPERGLERLLRRAAAADAGLHYVTGDLDPGHADQVVDVTAIDAPDASYDVVICSHVLEHVPDDRAALAEFRRVLRPGGVAYLVVPHDATATEVYEDWTITTPQAREVAFGQHDHVRLYSAGGFLGRLDDAGFAVERLTDGTTPGWNPEDLAVLARPR